MKKKTKKILLIGGIGAVAAISIITPIVVSNNSKKDEKEEIKIDNTIINEVKDKISSSENKTIIIGPYPGSINANKDKIIEKLKTSFTFDIKDIKDVKIDIKDDDFAKKNINIFPIPFTILLTRKNSDSKEIKGFKVKRIQTTKEIESDKDAVQAIINKITDKDLAIPTNSDISTDDAILTAIRKQLRAQNQTLSASEVLDIKDNIDSLTPGIRTSITLTIKIGDQLGTVEIHAKKLKTELEKENDITSIKRALESLLSKEVIISATSGTITTNKNEIKTKLEKLSGYPTNLKGVLVNIKDANATITPQGTTFTIVLSKSGVANSQEITTGFTVKRGLTQAEKDINSINTIKAKIIDKNITIPKDTATSNKTEILLAIKTQLRNDNSTLSSVDVLKIIDISISSLSPGVSTSVTLTIRIRSETRNEVITVEKEATNSDIVAAIKNKISDKDLVITKTIDTSDDAKILKAIKDQLKVENTSLTNIDLLKITDDISSLNPGIKTSVTLTITSGSRGDLASDTIQIHVTRLKTNQEINDSAVAVIKNKINANKDLTIAKNVDTSDKTNILAAIKAKLESDGTLNSDETGKITISISSLTAGVKTSITLTITVGNSNDTIQIHVTRPKTIKEKLENIELQIAKETATTNKADILAAIKARLETRNILTSAETAKITDISISSLIAGIKTSITLTIVDDSTNYSQTIFITKSLTTTQINTAKVKIIKDKINDKDLTITKTIDTSDDAKILKAIKDQLKVENTSLTNIDLLKITDDISSLNPGIRTSVILTITVGTSTSLITIHVTRPKTNQEINVDITAVKNAINALSSKVVTITDTDGTIESKKAAILTALQGLSNYPTDLKGTTIAIEAGQTTTLTVAAIPFVITISKIGGTTQKITTGFTVKRTQTAAEINIDKATVIKGKINNNKDLTIAKNVDTSNKTNILNAIKAKLESDGTLNSDETGKITISIISLTTGTRTSVTLTITVGSGIDVATESIIINVTKLRTDAELVAAIKRKITVSDIQIPKTVITSSDSEILSAIKDALEDANTNLTPNDLAKITDSISSLIPGVQTPVTLTITINGVTGTKLITVTRPKSNAELVKDIEDKIKTNTNLTIDKDVDTSDDANIWIAIKAKLKSQNSLTDDELVKITDNISSLTPGTSTPVTLTITIGSGADEVTTTITITVTRLVTTDEATIKVIIDKINDKNITIPSSEDTSNGTSTLNAIKAQLKIDNGTLTDDDLTKLDDNINLLNAGDTNIEVILTVEVNQTTSTITILVTKEKTYRQKLDEFLRKITNTKIVLPKTYVYNKNTLFSKIKIEFIKNNSFDTVGFNEYFLFEVFTLVSGYYSTISYGISLYFGTYEFFRGIDITFSKEPNNDTEKINSVKHQIKSLSTKDIYVTTNGAETINDKKTDILRILQNLSGYPQDVFGTTVTISDSQNIQINKQGVLFKIKIELNGASQEITTGFKVKQIGLPKEMLDIVNKKITKISSKILVSSTTSGTITSKKQEILDEIKKINGYPTKQEMNGVTIDIEDSSSNIESNYSIPFVIKISKSGTGDQKISSFQV